MNEQKPSKALTTDKDIDWFYWVKKSSWTVEQAALLKTGLSPDLFKRGKELVINDSAQEREYLRTLALLRDAVQAGKLKGYTPVDFRGFFGERYKIPTKLKKAFNQVFKWDGKDDRSVLNAKEQRSMLLMLGAIIKNTYQKESIPYAKDSLTTEIKSDLELMGVHLDDDTILKFIRRSYSTLSGYLKDGPDE